MMEPLLISRQRTLLRELYATLAARAAAEPHIDLDFQARNDAAEQEYQESCQKIIATFEADKDASQREFQETQEAVARRFQTERADQDKEWLEAQERITAQYETERSAAKTEFQLARGDIANAFELQKRKAESQRSQAQEQVAEAIKGSKRLQREALELLQLWRQDRDYGPPPPSGQPDRKYHNAFQQLENSLTSAEGHLRALLKLRLPSVFQGGRLVWLFIVLVATGAGLGALVGGEEHWINGLIIGGVAGLVLAAIASLWLYTVAKELIRKVYHPLLQAVSDAETAYEKAREQAREEFKNEVARARKLHDVELRRAAERFKKKRATTKVRRDIEWSQGLNKYEEAVKDSTLRRDTDLRNAHEKYQRRRTEIHERYETDSHLARERRFKRMTESKQRHDEEWNALAETWHQGLARAWAAVEDVNRQSGQLFPDWDSPSWQSWVPPNAVTPYVYFGAYRVDLGQLPGGLSQAERLKPAVPTQLALPALLDFPGRCSLLLKTHEAGQTQAVQVLQAVMLRYLTSLPPGKVRFTILDPIGLGENFAAFMHLADYDEMLVNSRIWTESTYIEQRLADLTAHMENVIQKYLRNQYETIEEYNAEAGEVAEPFRIAVIANFPANFSAEAARRLLSIVSSGARCGVYALIAVDTDQAMPHGFSLANLEKHTVNLEWHGDRFVWKDPDFERFPLRVETPPSADFCTRLLHVVGQKAREANRVEVPFDFIAPAPEQWWTQNSRAGIDVALGRAGATKRQHLKLGHGTAQHVLLAGKTGSGKSSLLHALIVNLALHYSPHEVELFLIDFKKGVEFKTYAVHELPHARIVAIESDREFGLSVLQRLDAELKLRGDRFREVNVQDLNAYREATGNLALPRILLVVDEFQEFFTEDDRVSQEAAQLLDRLVRQGRAFGLHVLLGTQTLAGAYTLARSTIDQMAVRIALQCSEADGHLILSDDNSAARLLSRPGEAIYNDANGLVEGNNPFQVVWLPEERRERLLQQIRELEEKRHAGGSQPQIVFEGNAAADIRKNYLLRDLLAAPVWPATAAAFHAWLGEAMAIKDPTAAIFRRQSGSNLLVVGQQEEAALGLLVTALLSLAAQHSPADESNRSSGARFYILDSTPAEAARAGYLAHLVNLLPHPVQVGGFRELAGMMAEVAAEGERRQKSNESEGPALYLFIHGLQRLRELRKEEDDYGFARGDEKPSPSRQLAELLREGASLGIHAVVWCDTLNNLARSLDRQSLRELEMRVLFQMSATDSSTLIDSPLAGKLGVHRALFHTEEEGRLEKFRPYGLPPEAWLVGLKDRLSRKRSAEPVRV